MVQDLGSILEHMDRLAEIDTEGVEPMAQVLYAAGETATLRPDVERAPLGMKPHWRIRRCQAAAISRCRG